MNQEEIHGAAMFETERNDPCVPRGTGSKTVVYFKFEMTSGYPQDAERR
jgi:hypothetical protein